MVIWTQKIKTLEPTIKIEYNSKKLKQVEKNLT